MKDFFRRLFQKKATIGYVDFLDDRAREYTDRKFSELMLNQTTFVGTAGHVIDEKIRALYRHLGLSWEYDGDTCKVVKPSPAKVKKVKAAKSLGAKKK